MSTATETSTQQQPSSHPDLPSLRRFLFTALLLCSGFCGISYEILYGRILGNLIGDQFTVTASILLTFLLGIGIGARFAHRLWPHLWLLEAGIGLYGAVFALCSGMLDEWLYAHISVGSTGLAGSLSLCVVLLLVPAFLIGTSLPLFAGYLKRLNPGSSGFSSAYALYNFGAAITVLAIEFWLIRGLGIRAATVWIAGANGLIAILLICCFRDLRPRTSVAPKTTKAAFPRAQLFALALASAGSAIYQLLMLKLAEAFLGPFRETFALVLCLILLGIALGSSLCKFITVTLRDLLLANLVGLALLLALFGYATELFASLAPSIGDTHLSFVALRLGILALVMLIPSVTFGATIPAMLSSQENVAKDSGQLLFVSSLGNVFGFLAMVLYLHQRLEYGTLTVIIALFTIVAFIVYRPKYDLRMSLAICLFAATIVMQQTAWHEETLYLGHRAFISSETLEETKDNFNRSETFKGPQDVFSITWINDRPHFYINGYVSIDLESPYEKIVGGFAAAFAPRTDKALVLGLGSGATAGSVAQMFDHTDAVEINGVVIENIWRMKKYNFDIENNPKVSIIHDDAIHYVRSSEEKYSLIINTVTTPLYFSSSKLYTLEFTQAVRERLSTGGIYATWIDGRVGERGVDIMLNTLAESFDYCALGYIRSSYLLLLCSQEPIRARQPLVASAAPTLAAALSKSDIRADLLPYALVHNRARDLVNRRNTALNTLDYPALEFEMTRLRDIGFNEFLERLLRCMSITMIKEALTPATDWNPVYLAAHAHRTLRDTHFTRRWIWLLSQELDDFEKKWGLADAESHDQYAKEKKVLELKRAIRIKKLVSRGNRLLLQHHYKNALLVFTTVLRIEPKKNNARLAIAVCYENMKKYGLALENYRAELSIDPADQQAPLRIARVYVKMGRFKRALEQLKSTAGSDEKPAAKYYRGKAHEGLGNFAEARKAYQRALAADPDFELAKAALSRLDTASPGRKD